MNLEDQINSLWWPASVDSPLFWGMIDTCFQIRYRRKNRRKMIKLVKNNLALALISPYDNVRQIAQALTRCTDV